MHGMSRDEVHIRDRLMMLAESTKPFNVKRKSISKQASKGTTPTPKLSMQDFVRMDPSYTPDIEHLVFPGRKRNPQQVSPAIMPTASKTRSRLAEMFALSRHLQQRSADRETKPRNPTINRSVDSVLEAPRDRRVNPSDRRWAVEEPVHSTRLSPNNEPDMATTRGPNVSVLHLRSTSEPWETSPTSVFTTSTGSSRSYSSGRSGATLTKHQSLGSSSYNPSYKHSQNMHPRSDSYAGDSMYLGSGCRRELSPVRWCDREVDGVYLGRSGWVQVQQRSLDENRRGVYVGENKAAASRRTGLKLAEYQLTNNVPVKVVKQEPQRPAYLPLKNKDFERHSRTPSPDRNPPESFSPPSVTPIISPPPAFQDRNKGSKSRTFFGKPPFLPRSNAIIDSDVSPPPSPPPTWRTAKTSSLPPTTQRKQKSPMSENHVQRYPRIPQTKSLEDTSAVRRTRFVQKYGESSSSSSQSSMGFRSLDSYVPRCAAMPRLSENTDSSIDVYEDADDEDNNSSSLNISIVTNTHREKISPTNRTSRGTYRNQIRRSPVSSDTKPASPGSSSSSSNEFPSRSPITRRNPPARQYQEDPRVRRSRSLQLPDRNYRERVSPQDPHRVIVKVANNGNKRIDEEMMREAEVVTGFLYGSRSRAAAQALLMHRYNNREEKVKEKAQVNNGYNVYLVGNSKPKVLQRGSTTPNLSNNSKKVCNSDSCDFWPHCAHRENLKTQAQSMMRSSQSYPTHQRSLDVPEKTTDYKKRVRSGERRSEERESVPSIRRQTQRSVEVEERKERKLSPNKCVERKASPKKAISNSSSSSEVHADRSKSPKLVVSCVTSPVNEEVKDVREVILTRPGSAPGGNENCAGDAKTSFLDSQQRSMSLPKSFLSRQGGQFPWKRRGTESLSSSPGLHRKSPADTSQTAPVTPLHDGNRRRSPIDGVTRRAKATSTPQLLDPLDTENRKWKNEVNESQNVSKEIRKSVAGNATESVLQKFRKTFSLRFQKKTGSKESSCASDVGETLSEILGEPSEEESPQHILVPPSSSPGNESKENEQSEQKYRFGPLIWRSSKERKKLNKAARSIKCNSGDSGIQIEMASGCVGVGGGGGGDSSESHDTDPAGEELDSPPTVRRRGAPPRGTRPHSDLLNQILIDRFKAELRTRAHKHQHVRRTHSDLSGQRIYQWDARTSYRRLMSSPAPLRARPQSPRKKPPDGGPPGVQLRNHPLYRRGQLRRSLSQPLDIDKLSPIFKTKAAALKMTGAAVSEDEHDGRVGTSDEEMMSDSESSVASLTERKKSLELPMDEDVVIMAEAVFDHVAIDAEELAFRAGDVIEVLETVNRDWWWGSADGRTGWFPADSVRLRVSQEDTVEDCLAAMASGKSAQSQIRRRTSISLLSNDQVRTSVVRELVHTERDFVKVLQDVAEGYMAECRKRKDMFSKEQIDTIFINLEEILKFQKEFLKDLESCINWEAPHKSCLGSCFIKHKEGFTMYSDYCNSHPMATATLQELYQFNNYSKFFEACRLMRGLIEIPLDGYLLTPVQRICKYPLQLAELLKYTKPEHPDYEDIGEALDAMRGVAVLINERKRRMESLEKIEAWQQRVEGWEGDDLIEHSTQLIHQGEVVRVTTGMWTSNIILFLFDHQLVYCKKDILKRSTHVYKGRICLDTSEIINVPDGKDPHLGVNVRHAIKLYSCVRDKWLLVCCRSANDKQRWLQAFADERRLVAQDRCDGLDFPASSRHLAKIAARCQRRPPRKVRSDKNYKRDASYMGSTLQLNTSNSNSLGRKVGTWFTFGGNKKTRHRDVS